MAPEKLLVPLAGIEPALLAELDFESSASTNSATGAFPTHRRKAGGAKPANIAGGRSRSTRVRLEWPEAQMRLIPVQNASAVPSPSAHCGVIALCLDSAGHAG